MKIDKEMNLTFLRFLQNFDMAQSLKIYYIMFSFTKKEAYFILKKYRIRCHSSCYFIYNIHLIFNGFIYNK